MFACCGFPWPVPKRMMNHEVILSGLWSSCTLCLGSLPCALWSRPNKGLVKVKEMKKRKKRAFMAHDFHSLKEELIPSRWTFKFHCLLFLVMTKSLYAGKQAGQVGMSRGILLTIERFWLSVQFCLHNSHFWQMIKSKIFLRACWHAYYCFPYLSLNFIPVFELQRRIKFTSSDIFTPRSFPCIFLGSSSIQGNHSAIPFQDHIEDIEKYIFFHYNFVFADKLSPPLTK